MKRSTVVGWVAVGTLAVACGAPPSNNTDDRATGGGGAGAGGPSFGTGGVGGSGGSVVIPPGSGGSTVRDGGIAGSGGGPTKAGTYTEAVVEAEDSPPPIAGGTLAIVGQGHRAAVSD